MFSRGGLAILAAIEAQGYDTLHLRPVVAKGQTVPFARRIAGG